MVTASQLRQARAALNIDQKSVCEACGLHKATLSDIENEKNQGSGASISSLQTFYESRGLEFTEDGGVRPARNFLKVYEGKDCYMKFLEDAHGILSRSKGEILFSAADEQRSPTEVIEKFRAMRKDGITMRSLIKDGDTFVMGNLDEYRWMKESLFVDGDVKVIYENRVAWLVSWLDNPRVILIHDKTIAQEALRYFNDTWENSKTPTESTSKVFYEDG